MEGRQTPTLLRAIDQVIVHQDESVEQLQREGSLDERLVCPALFSTQSSVGQKKKQGTDSFSLSANELAHVEKNRLEKITELIPLFLTMEKALHLLLKKPRETLPFNDGGGQTHEE
jgi:hypothetical protein